MQPQSAGRVSLAMHLEFRAADRTLTQPDGMHPNARGEAPVLDTVWPYLEPLLEKKQRTGGS